jgi:hypothetical protein
MSVFGDLEFPDFDDNSCSAEWPHFEDQYDGNFEQVQWMEPTPLFEENEKGETLSVVQDSMDQANANADSSSNSGKVQYCPKAAREAMLNYFRVHPNAPYPPNEVKAEFCVQYGLSRKQVKNLFMNGRRRFLGSAKERSDRARMFNSLSFAPNAQMPMVFINYM